jgi:hypothetical protein
MAYVDPNTVQSPRGLVEDIHVVYDKGPTELSWSIAQLKWDKRPAVGIRWNGDVDKPGSGQPQSRGNATWFIVPDEIADAVVAAAAALEAEKDDALYKSYCEMTADTEREAEAMEWSESLIGDGLEPR